MDYEEKYNRLLKEIDKYRNDLLDEKDLIEALLKASVVDSAKVTLHREFSMLRFAVALLDIRMSEYYKPLPLDNSDRVILNDATQGVVDEG